MTDQQLRTLMSVRGRLFLTVLVHLTEHFKERFIFLNVNNLSVFFVYLESQSMSYQQPHMRLNSTFYMQTCILYSGFINDQTHPVYPEFELLPSERCHRKRLLLSQMQSMCYEFTDDKVKSIPTTYSGDYMGHEKGADIITTRCSVPMFATFHDKCTINLNNAI